MKYLPLLLIPFILAASLCFAGDVQLSSEFTLRKEDYSKTRLLNKAEQARVKDALTKQGRKLISKHLTPAKNDYEGDYDRGTVHFNSEKGYNSWLKEDVLIARNYGHHKVIIPDDTIIKEVNFTQRNPHTDAIEGKNLTFIECNLSNVEVDPTWTIIGGLNIHIRVRIIEENGRTYEIYEVEKDGKFKETTRSDITPISIP